jgi:hypothetical protein
LGDVVTGMAVAGHEGLMFQRNGRGVGLMRASGVLVAALVWATAAPATAWAQEQGGDVARARELFVQASEMRDQGDARGALEKFKAAHALAVNPITAFELARTYAALGMLAEARAAYESIARIPVRGDETDRAKAARKDAVKAAGELRARIPEGAQTIAPAPAVATPAPAPAPATAPSAAAPADASTSAAVSPAVPGPAPAPASPASPPAASPPSAQAGAATTFSPADATQPATVSSTTGGNHFGPFAYAGFGIGAVGFVTGTILAVATLNKASSIDCSNATCWQASVDAAHATRDLGIAAAVSYTIAGAGVAVGVTDMLLYKHGPAQPTTGLSLHPWIGAGAAGMNGSF